ncbi:glycosyl hydrolase [Microbacterium sp. 2FI]|uniref:glycosyl hydrolase n=1 Tax=Microbacterium sp. 2FI TaxID=2502193 RepID=UPI00201756F4|nr:glycosyl hydrolase [Microbacterium sp. 2FI]
MRGPARRTRQRALGIAVATGIVATIAACAPTTAPPATTRGWQTPGASTDAATEVAALPVDRIAADVASRTADDLAPPTNRWYSGIAFETPERIFPFPLALDLTTASFAVSLPGVAVSPTTIATAEAPAIGVGVPADDYTVVAADPVSVTVRFTNAGAPVGDLTTASGWPVVAFTAATAVDLTADTTLTAAGEGAWTATIGEQEFGLRAPGADVADGILSLPAGATAQWFAVPADSDASAWAAALDDPITGVDTSYSTSDDSVATRLSYAGTDATVVVPLPGREPDAGCDLGTFATIHGTASACASTTLEWSVPRRDALGAYDLDGLDGSARTALAEQIAADLAATEPVPADTYFGGKGLARLGDLLGIARSIGDEDLADRIADRLADEFAPWTDPDGCTDRDERCFVYDDALRLVVGRTPSFGAEEGNDHHFHYGYFLAAAAALVEARPDSGDALAPVIDALAADISAGAPDEALPALRVFDPYQGHSWASGLSPFADGNNQESSSEAVAAWNGLARWASARGDRGLEATALWLLSAEADAARTQWLAPDLAGFAGYEHEIVSLAWGGKREYATWFSAEPSAILGIQVLPIGPIALDYLAGDPEGVARRVAEAGGDAAFDGALGEYVLAYSALGDDDARARAAEIVEGLDADSLDDGTSLSAILAWLAAVDLAGAGAR